MSYDPSRRKHAVPPQLRAWVFHRHKKSTHDPKRASMATGYGSVGRKPYRRGSRGGVAWSGGKTLRYDVPARKGWRAKAKGALGKVESNLMWVGLALGILVPSEACRASHHTSLYDHYVNGTIHETTRLFGKDPSVSPSAYLTWKFTNPQSPWCVTFWLSIAAQIATRLNAVSLVSARANTAIKKFSMGTLFASIIGGLFLQGGNPTAPSTSSSDTGNFSQTQGHIGKPYTYGG